MSAPIVSIIIPCFRQAHFLRRTIQCALAQTQPGIEVIVINDGSDDNTEEVAAEFADRIRYVAQENAGLPAARNAGIGAATGKYLHFLDSDDLLHPEALGWLVAAAGGRNDVLCEMGCRFFEKDDAMSGGIEKLPPAKDQFAAALMRGNPGPPHSYLCSREMMRRIGGFDTSLKSCEDWDAWARMIFTGAEPIPVPKVGAYYRQHPASMSRNNLRMAQTAAEVVRRNLRRMDEHPDRIEQLGGNTCNARRGAKQRLAEEYFNAGYYLREQGDYAAAAKQFWNAAMVEGPRLKYLKACAKLAPHGLLRAPKVATPAA
jgi:glycosyltransferase involved in cell wall biosynthesis